MASFNNVMVTGSTWTDLNTLSGAPVGTALEIQNIGSASVKLQESSNIPSNDNGGVLFTVEYGEMSRALVEAGSLKMWAKLSDPTKPTTLALFE